MIDIIISDRSVEVSGHANTAPFGQDLVCAAVSTLTYTLINYIKEHSDMFRVKDITADTPGYVYIVAIPHSEDKEKWGWVFEVIKIGYEMVAEEFAESVTVTYI